MDFALDAGILCFNVESEPELELLSARAVAAGQDRAGLAAHQSRCRRQDAQEDLDRQGREQVRHSLAARARRSMRAPPSCPASRSPASTCISAARSPSCSPSTTPSRCWPNWSARCAPTATRSSMSISAAGSAFPTAPTTIRRRCPTPMPRSSRSTSRKLGLKVMFEPGRLIVGNAGILVTEVIYVKEGDAKNFVIVDAAMNDLIRPTLYDAFHDIRPVVRAAGRCAAHDGRRRRPGLRDRRLSRPRPRPAAARRPAT